jgi:lipase (class 3)
MAANPQDPPVLTAEYAHAVPTWRAAYSDRTAAMMAAFSQLAYVPFLDVLPQNGARPEKAGGREQLAEYLRGGGFDLKVVFNENNVQAFIAVNSGEFAVLAFRGTANAADWQINLNALRIPLPKVKGVEIHTGFWDAFEDMAPRIAEAVNEYVPDNLGLYITGHSLGGALAQIASAMLERDNLAACYTYGSPRVATINFDICVKCPHYRLVNQWDLVPGVPAPTPWGYVHSGDPRLLKGPQPVETLRRDRDILGRAVMYLWSFLVFPIIRRLSIIDDHMIWNYRTKLERIADARAAPAIAEAAKSLDERGASRSVPPGGAPSEPIAGL